jgi:signal transduction histidine kinase
MLDSLTLVIALCVAFTLEAILFLLMTIFVKAYKGMRYWALGCTAMAMNFIVIYLRSIGMNEVWSILSANLFSVVSLLCFLYGSKHIMEIPYRLSKGLLAIVLFMGAISYYTFVIDSLNARIIIYSIMMVIILYLNAGILIKYNKDTFKWSAVILASLFFLIGTYFLIRAFVHIIHPVPDNNFFTNHGVQPLTLLVGLCLGTLWTQGVILLVNQKLLGALTGKTRELEANNAEKDKFFSILAHDLRGPLTTIMGMVDLLADKHSGLGEAVMQDMAEAMKKSVHSTNILMDNLLDWATLQRGLKEIQKVQITFGDLITPVMPTLTIQAESKKITIVDDIPAATPLFADPKMVQSIFRNLLANALKFTPANGRVQLLSNVDKDGCLVFSVKDNGIGMEKEVLDNLFQINALSRRTGTDGEKSTGLGLMLCKEFVEKHGGTIWVESEPGVGSTFSFRLESVPAND